FIAYENLVGGRKAAAKGGRPAPVTATAPIAQAFPLVRRALKILADREVTPQTGLLKSTLLQLDSTFSERNYASSSFLDFVEKLAQAGFITLKHAGRSVTVELNPSFEEGAPVESAGDGSASIEQPHAAAQPQAPQHQAPQHQAPQHQAQPHQAQPAEPVRATESAAAGVLRAGRILASATNARWPMYLRNVKQILRAAEGGFDERRYG